MRSWTWSPRRALPPDLGQRLLAREREAAPEALNLVDDRRPEQRAAALALLDDLERDSPRPGALRVGFTGAPGAGKSTLLDALVRGLRARKRTVAIVAVDPSSRRTGGALLGDRIRVRSASGDPGVFIRSLAARDRLGGLSEGTFAAVSILSAVFDWVCVETVGVGQSESDVSMAVDTVVFVANPGSGDALQFMKAGLLEIPDVFAVNKADLGAEASRTASELDSGLRLGERESAAWRPPVELVSARDGTGIDTLIDHIESHRRHLVSSGALPERRSAGRVAHVLSSLEKRYGSFGLDRLGGSGALEARIRADTRHSASALAASLGREIEDALSEPRGPG